MKKFYPLTAMFCFMLLCAKSQQTFQIKIGEGNLRKEKSEQEIQNMVIAANKDILVCSYSFFGDRVFVSRVNLNGQKAWSKLYTGANYAAIAETNDNGFVLHGHGTPSNQAVVIKCDSTGNIQWSKSINSSSYKFEGYYNICQSADGGFYISNGDFFHNIQLIKLGKKGELIWNKTFTESHLDFGLSASSLTPLKDSGVLLTVQIPACEFYCHDLQLMKFDKKGNTNFHTFSLSVPQYYLSPSALILIDKGTKIAGLFIVDTGQYEARFCYITLDLDAGIIESCILFPYNMFSLQAFSRTNHLGEIKNKVVNVSYPFVIRNNWTLAKTNPFYYHLQLAQYDSLGRICPDYSLPTIKYNTYTSDFFLPRFDYITVKNIITVEDLITSVQDENIDSIICSGRASDLFTASQTENEQTNSALKLYPNPANKFITLQYKSEKNKAVQIKIFDASGVLVKNIKDIFLAGQNAKTINVESLNGGMYFLRVQTESSEKNFQFLKE